MPETFRSESNKEGWNVGHGLIYPPETERVSGDAAVVTAQMTEYISDYMNPAGFTGLIR